MMHTTAISILNYAQTANHVAVNPTSLLGGMAQSVSQRLSELHATKAQMGIII